MNDLLIAGCVFDQYLYFVTDKTLFDIALETGVSPTNIISDNKLKRSPKRGDVLLIIKRKSLKMLLPEDFSNKDYLEEIKQKNASDSLHVFQLVNY